MFNDDDDLFEVLEISPQEPNTPTSEQPTVESFFIKQSTLDSIVEFKDKHPELIMGNDEELREEFPLNIEGPDMPLDVDTTEEEQK